VLGLPISAQPRGTSRCRVGSFEGEVKAGQQFVHPIGSGLELMLEPLPSGWILRVLPSGQARPSHDYAELATPPYHSVSPLLVSTDFSFRSQDAIGWTPRRFHFAASEEAFRALLKAYELYEAKPGATPGSQQALAALVSRTSGGTLTILDAKLVPGTADQAQTSATLAVHFTSTVHTIDAPAGGKATPLGRISWMRFRIALQLPEGFRPDRSLAISLQPCE
jgi:hypothetical protein